MGRKLKSVYTQVHNLFGWCRQFGESRHGLKGTKAELSALHTIRTGVQYERIVQRLVGAVAEDRGNRHYPVVSITREEVKRYLQERLDRVRPATIHQDLAALQKFEHMVNARYGQARFDLPRLREELEIPRKYRWNVSPQRGPAYTAKESQGMLAGLTARYGPVVRDAYVFVQATGCRKETLFDLKEKGVTVDRVDLAEQTVRLLEKNGKDRVVHYDARYHQDMVRMVEEAVAEGRERLFGADRLPAERGLYKAMRRIGEEQGFANRGFHGVRKEFAVNRYREYRWAIRALVEAKDAKGLSRRFRMPQDMAERMVSTFARMEAGTVSKEEIEGFQKGIDWGDRARLTLDLGHNRIEVTFCDVGYVQ